MATKGKKYQKDFMNSELKYKFVFAYLYYIIGCPQTNIILKRIWQLDHQCLGRYFSFGNTKIGISNLNYH